MRASSLKSRRDAGWSSDSRLRRRHGPSGRARRRGRAVVGRPASGAGAALGHPLRPPADGLPKGGGAIRGIGEKFGANPVAGTGSFRVPIAVSQGRSGFGPELSLSYDSGSGNGPFGFGWELSL